MPDNLKVGVIGAKIVLNTTITLTGFVSAKIYYKKPDSDVSTGSFTAVEESDTSISYTTVGSGELDVAGIWGWESYVVLSDFSGYGERVFDQIDPHL